MKTITQPDSIQRLATALSLAARVAFACTLILIPFRLRLDLVPRPAPPVYADYVDLFLFASDAGLLCTLTLWWTSILVARRRISLGPRCLWIPLAALTAIGAASAAVSYDPLLSTYQALRLLLLFWFYVYIVNEIRSIAWIVVPVTIQVILQSVVALGQFIAQRSLDLQALGELQLDPAWSGVGIVVANGVRLLRVYGLSDHPNILGGCLAFALVFLLGAYLHGSSRTAVLAAFVCGLAALLVTFSRAAWLAFFAGSTMILVVEALGRRWDSLKALIPLAAVSAVLVASIVLAYSRFFGVRLDLGNSYNVPSVEQQSIGERAILIQAALPLFLQHPLLGVGLGASPLALQSAYPGLTVPYQPAHLTLLDAAVETGLPGAVAYLFLSLAPFVLYFRRAHLLLADRFATVAIAVLFSILVVGAFDYYTWLLVAGRLWQWLAWGIWGLASIQWPAFQLTSDPVISRKVGVFV